MERWEFGNDEWSGRGERDLYIKLRELGVVQGESRYSLETRVIVKEVQSRPCIDFSRPHCPRFEYSCHVEWLHDLFYSYILVTCLNLLSKYGVFKIHNSSKSDEFGRILLTKILWLYVLALEFLLDKRNAVYNLLLFCQWKVLNK
jgi:hypothetical protein